MLRLSVALSIMFAASNAQAETPSNGVLEVRSDSTVHVFQIEIADEPEERSLGLMFRDALEDDAGMLFLYPTPRIASFWMKNTKISLDMLFFDTKGEIVTIAPNTTPFSLSSVQSDAPVIGVLEIDGGDAERLGIEVGDTIKWTETPPAK